MTIFYSKCHGFIEGLWLRLKRGIPLHSIIATGTWRVTWMCCWNIRFHVWFNSDHLELITLNRVHFMYYMAVYCAVSAWPSVLFNGCIDDMWECNRFATKCTKRTQRANSRVQIYKEMARIAPFKQWKQAACFTPTTSVLWLNWFLKNSCIKAESH